MHSPRRYYIPLPPYMEIHNGVLKAEVGRHRTRIFVLQDYDPPALALREACVFMVDAYREDGWYAKSPKSAAGRLPNGLSERYITHTYSDYGGTFIVKLENKPYRFLYNERVSYEGPAKAYNEGFNSAYLYAVRLRDRVIATATRLVIDTYVDTIKEIDYCISKGPESTIVISH